ncbi:Uncharacterised protein [Mobiluncus holmesii]|nr:Uncharacterised protein [Mobiluncus holmesii]
MGESLVARPSSQRRYGETTAGWGGTVTLEDPAGSVFWGRCVEET